MIYLIILIIILFFINYSPNYMTLYENCYFNYLLFLISKAGIVYLDKYWSSILENFTGDHLALKNHRKLRSKYGNYVKAYIISNTTNIYILNPTIAKRILEMSPLYFDSGLIKKRLFDSIMPNNVGTSTCNKSACPWKKLRKFNEDVLSTNKTHSYILNYILSKIEFTTIPKDHNDWNILAFNITSNILFGDYNSVHILRLFYKNYTKPDFLNSNEYLNYKNYIMKYIDKECLIGIMYKNSVGLSKSEFLDQIPHIFAPSIFMVEFLIPIFLATILNSSTIFGKILKEISNNFDIFSKSSFLHYCIIEHIRLFNTININIQRTSKFNISIDNIDFKIGDQVFILFSSILRDTFQSGDKFIPNRWYNKNLDQNIVFGVGSQKCVSINYTPIIYKALAIKLLPIYKGVNTKIDISKDLYYINPFNLVFF
jgi:hypothetical protein